MKKKILALNILVICSVLYTNRIQAQQRILYNQHNYNVTPLNPSASLIRPEGEIAVIGRKQWTGIDGAPSLLWVSGYAPISSINATVGVNARAESLGEERNTDASLFIAKSVRLAQNDFFSVSVSGGIISLKQNISNLDAADPVAASNVDHTSPQVGLGITLFNPDKYYVGLSAPRVVLQKNKSDMNYNLNNTYYLTGGILLKLDDNFSLKPSTVVGYSKGANFQGDISLMGYAKETLGLGVNVKTYGGVAGLFQYKIKKFSIGYSYQFNLGNQMGSSSINNSSQEAYLSYRFGSGKLGL